MDRATIAFIADIEKPLFGKNASKDGECHKRMCCTFHFNMKWANFRTLFMRTPTHYFHFSISRYSKD